MSDTSIRNGRPGTSPDPGDHMPPELAGRPSRRKRPALRIALISFATVFALVAGVAVAGILALNHLANNIHRIPVKFAPVAAVERGTAAQGAMTVLLTGANTPGGAGISGLIMLLHVNATHQAGGVVSIPPGTEVSVPGHGRMPIQRALAIGGPSLLVATVENATHVQLKHYARIDFSHVSNVVNAEGGVNVTLPAASGVFHAGVNHLNGAQALAYTHQVSLSENGRVQRQQSLIRAVLKKMAKAHLLSNPTGTFSMLSALTAMLTVDSNFTNSQLVSLASQLKGLGGGAGTFVSAPVSTASGREVFNTAITSKLWRAIRHDSIAAFAQKYPSTVTPSAVP
jgi:LCP family protein required for cell wall assembly